MLTDKSKYENSTLKKDEQISLHTIRPKTNCKGYLARVWLESCTILQDNRSILTGGAHDYSINLFRSQLSSNLLKIDS